MEESKEYGSYSGKIQTEWLEDGRDMIILNNVYYIGGKNA